MKTIKKLGRHKKNDSLQLHFQPATFHNFNHERMFCTVSSLLASGSFIFVAIIGVFEFKTNKGKHNHGLKNTYKLNISVHQGFFPLIYFLIILVVQTIFLLCNTLPFRFLQVQIHTPYIQVQGLLVLNSVYNGNVQYSFLECFTSHFFLEFQPYNMTPKGSQTGKNLSIFGHCQNCFARPLVFFDTLSYSILYFAIL